MKIIRLYSIMDKKTGNYDTPFFCFNDIMAERRFIMTVREKQSIFHHFSADFDLVYLGQFDVTTGTITAEQIPLPILQGTQIQKEDN